MTAPKIDTQAPERIWITSERSLWPTHRSFTASDLDHSNDDGTSDYPEYERRDLADARAAAAYKRGIETSEAYTAGWDAAFAMMGKGAPSADTAALDRLIAERVRAAFEEAAKIAENMARVTPAPMNDGCGTVLLQPVDGYQVGKAIRAHAARGSKECQS